MNRDNRKIKLIGLLLLGILIFLCTGFVMSKHTPTEKQYLQNKFISEGLWVNQETAYIMANLPLNHSTKVTVLPFGEREITLTEVEVLEEMDVPYESPEYGKPNTMDSYSVNGQQVCALTSEEHELMYEGKLRNRLYQKSYLKQYTFEVKNKDMKKEVIVELQSNLNGIYNDVTYYCNPIQGEFDVLRSEN